MATDTLGDRCKKLEMAEAGRRAMPGLPLLARLDGRAFHTFTRDLRRPYDERMSRLMIETARFLVQELSARIAYTQSSSVLAGLASARSATDEEWARIPEAHRPPRELEILLDGAPAALRT